MKQLKPRKNRKTHQAGLFYKCRSDLWKILKTPKPTKPNKTQKKIRRVGLFLKHEFLQPW